MNYLTHNGIITLENPVKETHRTIKIRTVQNGKWKGTRKVFLLSGPDNEQDYLCVGFIKPNGEFYFWDTVPEGTKKIIECLKPEKIEKYGLNVLFEGKCRRCNRKLTTPDSIRLGIGPKCRGEI